MIPFGEGEVEVVPLHEHVRGLCRPGARLVTAYLPVEWQLPKVHIAPELEASMARPVDESIGGDGHRRR